MTRSVIQVQGMVVSFRELERPCGKNVLKVIDQIAALSLGNIINRDSTAATIHHATFCYSLWSINNARGGYFIRQMQMCIHETNKIYHWLYINLSQLYV